MAARRQGGANTNGFSAQYLINRFTLTSPFWFDLYQFDASFPGHAPCVLTESIRNPHRHFLPNRANQEFHQPIRSRLALASPLSSFSVETKIPQ
jgi:hypothetical protein